MTPDRSHRLGTPGSGQDPTPAAALVSAFELATLKRTRYNATPRWRRFKRRRLHADLVAACIVADARRSELGAPWSAMGLLDVLDLVEAGALVSTVHGPS